MKNIINSKQYLSALGAFIIVLFIGSNTALAHHSFAMYDTSESITFTGKVFRFIPGANHAQILFEVIDEDGQVRMGDNGNPLIWGLETGSSSGIARQGVTVAAFPIGTVVKFSVHPLRNGKTFGLQDGFIVHCGNVLPEGGCTENTGEVFMRRRGF